MWGGGLLSAALVDQGDRGAGAIAVPVVGPIVYGARAGDGMLTPMVWASAHQAAAITLLTVGSVSLSRHRRLGYTSPQLSENGGIALIASGALVLTLIAGPTFGFAHRLADNDPYMRRLQIPIVGGIAAAPEAPSYMAGYLGLTSSAIQLMSVGAIAYGGYVVANHRKHPNLSLLPMPSREGGQVVFAMQF